MQVFHSLMKTINVLGKMQNTSSPENITIVMKNAESFVEKLPATVSAETKVTLLRNTCFAMHKLHG